MNRFDALVVGAGPSGSAAALLLARAGWKVAIAERSAFPRRKVCGEYVSGASWPLLQELGVAEDVMSRAGPEITRVGFFARDAEIAAPMPQPVAWGRALGRETLDTLLLEAVKRAGARSFQPCTVEQVEKRGGELACSFAERKAAASGILRARIVIAAHGAWEPGGLPTQEPRRSAERNDLLGFKAHFRGARLEPSLMPLVLFPGGYGGLVSTDGGRVSFSCCVRREVLEQARAGRPHRKAGDALLDHVLRSNAAMTEVLRGARLDGSWLAAGPVRPGIRKFRRDGVFAVGNAAGESHPLIAEGISMAIQSSFLLCERLAAIGDRAFEPSAQRDIAREYEAAWRRNFSARVHAAGAFARLTTSALTATAAIALLRAFPGTLTLGARWSGKSQPLAQRPFVEAA